MFRTSRYQNFSISQIFQYTKQKVLCNFHKDSTHSGFLVAWQTLLHKRDVVGQYETQLKTIIVMVYNGNILGGILLPVPRRYDYRVSVMASLDKLYSRPMIFGYAYTRWTACVKSTLTSLAKICVFRTCILHVPMHLHARI